MRQDFEIEQIAMHYALALDSARAGNRYEAGKHFGFGYGIALQLKGAEGERACLLSTAVDTAVSLQVF